MVSFHCENCNDVLTKKKLDPHRNQCRGAIFTCLDCSTTFYGTDYRAHTSCITEDQKYQGALYREKPSKASKKKSVSILEPTNTNALVPRQPYVEDAPDVDTPHPPHVPSPPPAVPQTRDSVFDYMVDDDDHDDQPDTPHIKFNETREEMAMKNGAPGIFATGRASSRNGYRNKEEQGTNQEYDANGFSYGTEPVVPRPYGDMNASALSLEFMTPAAKITKARLEKKDKSTPGHSRTNSGSEKKRKRDENIHELEGDTLMADVPGQLARSNGETPAAAHSGLTGGLSRMLSEDKSDFPFRDPDSSEDDRRGHRERSSRRSNKQEDPASPLKRSRHNKEDPGLGISIKGRAVKALSMVGGALLPSQQENESGKTRRRASSSDQAQSVSRGRDSEKRERKKHKVHRHNGTSSANVRHEPRSRRRTDEDSPDAGRRKLKAIEYRKHDDSGSDSEDHRRKSGNSQMVVFGEEEKLKRRCTSFLANVPGTESDKGYSINKALKRWHKQNDIRSNSSKIDEEKELWRGLRLRKNERGEIVVFFLSGVNHDD